MNSGRKRVLIRGIGAAGSAIAHTLFCSGYLVVLHDSPRPTHIRRGTAFVDAAFDGDAWLEGVRARRVTNLASLERTLLGREAIPVYTGNYQLVLSALRPDVLIDARMRFRDGVECQRGLAPLVIGVGPGFVAGEHVTCAIETVRSDPGRIVLSGPTRAEASNSGRVGSRCLLVHAPKAGVFSTTFDVGDRVNAGELVACVDTEELRSPLTGVLSGLTYNGVTVRARATVIEIDPRSSVEPICRVEERHRRIARGALEAIEAFSPKEIAEDPALLRR